MGKHVNAHASGIDYVETKIDINRLNSLQRHNL